jgi:hypothetical protein
MTQRTQVKEKGTYGSFFRSETFAVDADPSVMLVAQK